MEQRVVIKISGKEFSLKANSPEMEQMMRVAAEQINQMLTDYNARYPDRPLADKLAFVALNQAVFKISYERRLETFDKEVKEMTAETDKYLKSIEEK